MYQISYISLYYTFGEDECTTLNVIPTLYTDTRANPAKTGGELSECRRRGALVNSSPSPTFLLTLFPKPHPTSHYTQSFPVQSSSWWGENSQPAACDACVTPPVTAGNQRPFSTSICSSLYSYYGYHHYHSSPMHCIQLKHEWRISQLELLHHHVAPLLTVAHMTCASVCWVRISA